MNDDDEKPIRDDDEKAVTDGEDELMSDLDKANAGWANGEPTRATSNAKSYVLKHIGNEQMMYWVR